MVVRLTNTLLILAISVFVVDSSYLRACRRSRFDLDVVLAFSVSPVADAFPYLFVNTCRRSRFDLDVVLAFGVSPVADAFPYNLFANSRTPTSVTSFTRALLQIFDYVPTRVALVSYNRDVKVITGFTNNRNVLWSSFSRWQPGPGVPSLSEAFENIRGIFASSPRRNSRRILVLLTDQPAVELSRAQTQAGFLRVGYGDAYAKINQLRTMAGVRNRGMGVSNNYYLPRIVGNIKTNICAMLRVRAPIYPTPPTTTLKTTAVKVTFPPSPIKDEVVILADDSESTRDFSGFDYFYNNDSKRFLGSVINSTDFGQCRLAVYLFSRDVRGLYGNLTTSKTALNQALGGMSPPDNGFSTTNTADAITKAATVLSSSSIPSSNKYILLMTDGQPDDIDEAVKAAVSARASGIKIGIVLSPLFDGDTSYRLSDMERIIDSSQGDAIKVLNSRKQLNSIISPGFCPIANSIFDK